MPKNKKVNTENAQIKHYLSPKYVVIYRPDLYNLKTRKKPAQKVTKNCIRSFLKSQY